jgi:hypothetical protein
MRCSVMYSKKRDIYEIKIDNPFAEPFRVNAEVFREFLRKHGVCKEGTVPMSGLIHVDKRDIALIL